MIYRLLHNIGTENHPNYNTREEVLACNDVLTFDGVYRNVLENVDVLKGKNVILFPMGDYFGKDNTFDLPNVPKLEQYCTPEEITQIQHYVISTGGTCDIGWHTYSHPDLTAFSKENIIPEVKKPSVYVTAFAYPYGRYNELVKQCVKEAGYKRAFSVFQTDGDEFSIPRPYLNK